MFQLLSLNIHTDKNRMNYSAAEDNPNCSIYGMPVLRVWKSKDVIVLKRSIGSTGYAGMQNPILFKDNTDVLLGDAQKSCEAIRTKLADM